MSEVNDGGPAFPVTQQSFGNGIVLKCVSDGMSLRDYFAGMALQGIIAQPLDNGCVFSAKLCSVAAYEYADAMLAARDRKESA